MKLGALVVCTLSLSLAIAADPAPPRETQIPTPEERERLLWGARREPAPAPADTLHATAQRAAQDNFDVTNYFLDLTFDEVARRVTGTVTVTATSLLNGLTHVVLDLNDNMLVTGVTRAGIPLTVTRGSNLLDVTLDQPFNSGLSFSIVVTYGGVPSVAGSFIGWNKYSGGTLGTMIWTLSEPTGARYWWPCKDRPDDKALVQEWWTVKSSWIASGNGVLQGTDTVGSRKRYRWASTHPLTTYLVSCTATDFVSFTDSYTPIAGGSMPLVYHVYSEDLTEAQTSFSATPSMVSYFAQLFGEYPFVEDRYGMTAFPFSGGMEHTTNTSYGYTLINGTHQFDWVIAHELAHQWWGDSVSPESWENVWLNEGFASYSEALWAEHTGGPAAYRSYMQSMWHSSFSTTVYNPSNLFGTTVYDKGGWCQHMLRGVLGDASFFAALANWYTTHKDSTGNTAQYEANAEAFYGAPLDFFFQQWVYGTGMPSYQWGWSNANLGGGNYRTWVRIHQVQSGPGTFTMPVQLTLVSAAGSEVRSVWNDGVDQDFALDTTAPVIDVLFDDANWILKSGATEISLADVDADGIPDRNDPDDDNDLLADVDDCAPLDGGQGKPAEVAAVTVAPGQLSWTAAARSDSYDLTRGLVSGLAAGYGACFAPGVAGLSYVDAELPADGQSFAYLVRGVDAGCGGAGSLGTNSAGTPRPSPCP